MYKPLSELRAEDFEKSKVWEYHGNADADATVQASSQTEIAEDDDCVYLAFTKFQLADGTSLSGFTSPADDSGLDYVQPVIFHDGRQLTLWSDDDGIEDISRELGKSSGDVYPIHWESYVLVNGERRKGNIAIRNGEELT